MIGLYINLLQHFGKLIPIYSVHVQLSVVYLMLLIKIHILD